MLGPGRRPAALPEAPFPGCHCQVMSTPAWSQLLPSVSSLTTLSASPSLRSVPSRAAPAVRLMGPHPLQAEGQHGTGSLGFTTGSTPSGGHTPHPWQLWAHGSPEDNRHAVPLTSGVCVLPGKPAPFPLGLVPHVPGTASTPCSLPGAQCRSQHAGGTPPSLAEHAAARRVNERQRRAERAAVLTRGLPPGQVRWESASPPKARRALGASTRPTRQAGCWPCAPCLPPFSGRTGCETYTASC